MNQKIMHERFAKDLARLNPRSKYGDMQLLRLDHLYGALTIPDACPALMHGYSDSKARPYPFILGEDERTAAEIYKSLEPLIIDRANEIMRNDIVREAFNETEDYLGKLNYCDIVIGKEIVLPERFKQEVFKSEHIERKTPQMSLTERIRSGQLLIDLEKDELFDAKLIRILQKEKMGLSNMTVVDVAAWAKNLSYVHSIELMERVAGTLKNEGYVLKKDLPWLNASLWGKGERAYVTLSELRDCSHLFIGEVKIIESPIPEQVRGRFVKRTGKRTVKNDYEERLSRVREFTKGLWAAADANREEQES